MTLFMSSPPDSKKNKLRRMILLMITILLLSTIFVGFTSNSSVEDFDEGQIQSNVKDDVNLLINGFAGGFVENIHQKSQHIHYFVQSKTISVGFSQSYLQFVTFGQTTDVVSLNFLDSNPVTPQGVDALDTKYTYFKGVNSSEWIESSYYQRIVYEDIYDNIDLYYELNEGSLKYEFYVYPGGDVGEIKLSWSGLVEVKSGLEGMIVQIGDLSKDNSITFLDSNPINYDSEMRNNEIIGSFKEIGYNLYGFDIPSYDTDKLLIIDPTIIDLATYISGSDEDFTDSMVLDASDNIYVTGSTKSTDFPTSTGAFDNTSDALSYTWDAFVLKLSSDGSTLLYSTYIATSGNEYGKSIVVDDFGNAYVTGFTGSTDFPTTAGALNETRKGSNDAFVLKLSSDGSTLLFSTYFGGSDDDEGLGIAIDTSHDIYITGNTRSTDLPTTVGANDTVGDGTISFSDTFIAKLSSDGSSLNYSTYISGSSYDTGKSIKVDSSGNAHITGIAYSSDFPTTFGAHDRTLTGATDAFATKVSANGSTLLYSTYLSLSSSTDDAADLVLDTEGNAYVTGNYYISSFMRIFVIKLAANGSKILNSKSMPASGHSYGRAITLDGSGNIYVAGFTDADDFEVTANAVDSTGSSGNTDSVMFKLSPDMSQLNYSTYLGGSGVDQIYAIGINSIGNVITAGKTSSTDFPVTSGVYNSTGDNSTTYDIFVASVKLQDDTIAPIIHAPSTASYEFGSIDNILSWNVADDFPGTYNITVDGILLGNPSNPWTTGTITINVDNLSIGSYVYNLTIYDGSGNMEFHVVTLTVSDTTSPIVNSIPDYEYEQGTIGNILSWSVDELVGAQYILYKDNEVLLTGDLSESIIILNIDGLLVGLYNFTLYVYDSSGNFAVDAVIVTVVDTIAPEVNSPEDVSYSLGSTENTIIWESSDLNPFMYNITVNGGIHTPSTSWENGSISANIDGLDTGIFNFTIFVYDFYGNYATDSVIVEVINELSTTSRVITTSETDNIITNSTVTGTVTEGNSGFLPLGIQFYIICLVLISYMGNKRRK